MKSLFRELTLLTLVLLAMVIIASPAYGSIDTTTNYIWSGIDTNGPVQVYTEAGVFAGPWGMSGATGTALDGAGHVYTVQPGGSDSVITKYDANQNGIGTIHFTSGIENGNGSPSWIEDMAYAGNNTLWLSGFNGIVYRINSAGNILTDWDTGHTYVGIATDGSFVYTTTGFFSGNTEIDKWTLAGAFVSSFSTTTGVGQGGLAYDSADGTFADLPTIPRMGPFMSAPSARSFTKSTVAAT